jgi:hypothetical protein
MDAKINHRFANIQQKKSIFERPLSTTLIVF